MNKSLTHGVSNIMVTPFTPDQVVDLAGVRAVTSWAIDAGVDSLVPLGIMGEAHKLTDEERALVLRTVIEEAAGRVPVVAGCTAESTSAAIARVLIAQELGASAVMIAPPRSATSPALQMEHYTTVASASAIPIVVQDEPVTTGIKMLASTIGAIGRNSGIGIVKVEEAPSPTKVSGILAENDTLACFGGLGGLYMIEELDRGASGIMTGFGYPEVLVSIYRDYAAGRVDEARMTFFRFLPLIRYEAQLGVGGVSIRKTLLMERGIIAHDTVRRPAAPGDPLSLVELRALIAQLSPGRPTQEDAAMRA